MCFTTPSVLVPYYICINLISRVIVLLSTPLSLPHLEGRTCHFYDYSKSCSGSNCPLSTIQCKDEQDKCFSVYGYATDGTLKVLEYNRLVNIFHSPLHLKKGKNALGNKRNPVWHKHRCQSFASQACELSILRVKGFSKTIWAYPTISEDFRRRSDYFPV